jgi:spermidine/putrescine-binding protein
VTSWANLWDKQYTGKIISWKLPRYIGGASLKALGYSANSENPPEIRSAFEHLAQLRSTFIFPEEDEGSLAPYLLSGQAVIAIGSGRDYAESHAQNNAITFVYPQDGGLLWGDNFVIPVRSTRQAEAELLINFLLEPEISAQIVNANRYATANESARPWIDPAILNDPVVFPPAENLANVEIVLAIPQPEQKLQIDLWEKFLATP